MSGERAFALGGKQPFGLQPLFELLQLQLKLPSAGRSHGLYDELVVTAWFIEREASLHQNLLPLLRPKGDAAVLSAKHGTAHLSARVLEREVPVS